MYDQIYIFKIFEKDDIQYMQNLVTLTFWLGILLKVILNLVIKCMYIHSEYIYICTQAAHSYKPVQWSEC